jgi:hypothetical protein
MKASVLAWSIAALGLGLTVTFHVLDLLNDHRYPPPIVGTFVGPAFVIVGALVASQRPRNPIGWLYLIAVTLVAFGGSRNVSDQYAYYTLVTRPGSLPAPEWVVWAGTVLLAIGFAALLLYSLLLFPNGRLPSRRWRPVGLGAALVVVAVALESALAPGTRETLDVAIVNPAGIAAAADFFDTVGPVFAGFVLVVVVAAIASTFVRFHTARGVERQQLMWFAYGAAWIPATALLTVALSVVAPNETSGFSGNAWPLSVAGIPIATALAILRHRLYDIDVLINRTLVYGATSAAIGAAFLGGIVVLQSLLRPFTSGSEIAVAGSTLASVALFQPIRRRIQHGVDRRFYRSRYDAERTVDEFSVRLRDEVELDAVRAELIDAVGTTLSPAHASVWLRGRAR